jgi:ADP-heptose:LPS heptosyltransferase
MPYFDEVVESPGVCTHCHSILWFFNKEHAVHNLLGWARQHKVEILVNPVRVRSLGYDYLLSLLEPKTSIAYDTGMMESQYPMTAAYQKRHCDGKYTHLIPATPGGAHLEELATMCRLATGSNVPLSPCPPDEVSLMLAPPSFALPDRFMVLIPGANVKLRRWPAERFAEVARRLRQFLSLDVAVIVVGVQEETPMAETICRILGENAVNLCGRTSLPELGTILKNAMLVITNETGTAHYAAVVHSPTVCIVGGGDFNAYFPNGFYKNVKSVFHRDSCFWCRWLCTRCKVEDSAAPCILSVTVDDVFEAAKSLVGTRECQQQPCNDLGETNRMEVR